MAKYFAYHNHTDHFSVQGFTLIKLRKIPFADMMSLLLLNPKKLSSHMESILIFFSEESSAWAKTNFIIEVQKGDTDGATFHNHALLGKIFPSKSA